VRLVYGGSVTPDNAAGLWRGEDVDGFLVGGAGLDPARFLAIISVCG
jgi:triosephosphate isomerase